MARRALEAFCVETGKPEKGRPAPVGGLFFYPGAFSAQLSLPPADTLERSDRLSSRSSGRRKSRPPASLTLTFKRFCSVSSSCSKLAAVPIYEQAVGGGVIKPEGFLCISRFPAAFLQPEGVIICEKSAGTNYRPGLSDPTQIITWITLFTVTSAEEGSDLENSVSIYEELDLVNWGSGHL